MVGRVTGGNITTDRSLANFARDERGARCVPFSLRERI